MIDHEHRTVLKWNCSLMNQCNMTRRVVKPRRFIWCRVEDFMEPALITNAWCLSPVIVNSAYLKYNMYHIYVKFYCKRCKINIVKFVNLIRTYSLVKYSTLDIICLICYSYHIICLNKKSVSFLSNYLIF